MTTKRKPGQSVIGRFSGKRGRPTFVAALRTQALVGGNQALAEELAGIARLKEVKNGYRIVNQGDSDNSLYLIISGRVSVRVNGREIAVRHEGMHVGEMALIDATARRSATVVAVERVVVAEVAQDHFTEMADRHPELWRRLAIELGRRLRERTRFVTEPNSEPEIFIGSSNEGLRIAKAINRCVDNHPRCIPLLWTRDVFQPSGTAIEDLVATAKRVDFAALVITPDDVVVSRGARSHSPRDNIVFELGLFMGSLGRNRTILIQPRGIDIKIPSDLLGLTCLRYTHPDTPQQRLRLGTVVPELYKHINRLGPR